MARLFGTDGVRGDANIDLKPELAYRLGRAAALYFGEGEEDAPTIIIGRDTRISGPMFEAALAAGICSAGGIAVMVGVIPTPGIAYLTKFLKAQAGIVISASHNPYHDNGIKFFGGDGYKLPDAVEDEIEQIVYSIENNDTLNRPYASEVGTIIWRHELLDEYKKYVISTATTNLEGLKVVLDCANGAAYEVMPKVLNELGAEVIVTHAEPNGININSNCGSTHLDGLIKTVLAEKADIGIAHDGDADRCLCVDDKGQIIDGDHILVMCALAMKKEGTLKNDTVVSTVMANIGFHQAMKEIGCKVEITKVGDRYVLENMRQKGHNLGGEQSGHVIFSDFATTGDGLITALQVLCAVKKSNNCASDLTNLMTTYPQLLVNVRVATQDGWEEREPIQTAIKKGEVELGDTGRILVRASGTEPLIRVMAEGKNEVQLEDICQRIATVIKEEMG